MSNKVLPPPTALMQAHILSDAPYLYLLARFRNKRIEKTTFVESFPCNNFCCFLQIVFTFQNIFVRQMHVGKYFFFFRIYHFIYNFDCSADSTDQ